MTQTTAATGAAGRPADIEAARGWLADLFAPWVQALNLQVESVAPGEACLRLPFDASLCRIGGTICGQALMAAADTAMVIAIGAQLGEIRPMTTVSLNTSFMRAVSGSDVRIVARVLKPGKTLMFGSIDMTSAADDRLAAQVTTTYAML